MQLTNTYDLPETVVNAMRKQEQLYSAGAVDSSVTTLIQPPRISALRRKHFKEMTSDVSEGFFALLGSGVHHILEMGATPGMIVEERLFMTIDGWKISGALDLQEVREMSTKITDYKVTTAYAITMNDGPKDEWVHQMNLQAMLVEANKAMRVVQMSIVAVIRDWSGSEAKRKPDYPKTPIVVVDIPIWPMEQRLEYARERIAKHRRAAFDVQMGEELEYCTNSDRWVRNDSWAVIKEGGKRATRNFDNPIDADEFVLNIPPPAKGKPATYQVVFKPGRSTRCEFCGVSEWCDQFQNHIKPAETETEDEKNGGDG